MRRLALVLILVAAGVTGCGDQQQAYCNQFSKDQVAFSDIMNGQDPGAALLAHIPMLKGLSERAPSDLAAQWQTFVNAVVGLQEALRAAGAKPSEFHGNKVPDRIKGQARADIVAAASRLGEPDVTAAVGDIEQQARDVCKINLGL